MLDNLTDFEDGLTAHESTLLPDITARMAGMTPHKAVIGEMHCSRCGDSRRMEAQVRFPGLPISPSPYGGPWRLAKQALILCELSCVQCSATCTALKCPSPNGSALVVAWSTFGGLSTQNTPPAVAYYLDQGHKSRSVAANSAAVAMYRAALEHLLHEQGFTTGMLNSKILELDAAITAGRAPAWARDLDTAYLKVIKELGNGAIHTNGGDVTKQWSLDSSLLALVEVTFAALLQVVYEIPQKKAATLAALKAKAALVK